MERYFDYQNYSKYKVPSLDAFDRNNVDDVLNFIRKINAANSKNPRACKERTHEELHLKGDISWGADVQFKNEALMATRLANFISAFLQVVDPKEVFPGTRVVDKPLTEDQMIGNIIRY